MPVVAHNPHRHHQQRPGLDHPLSSSLELPLFSTPFLRAVSEGPDAPEDIFKGVSIIEISSPLKA